MLELNAPLSVSACQISATAVQFPSRGRARAELPPTCAPPAAQSSTRGREETPPFSGCESREKAAAKILKIFVSHIKSSKAIEHRLAHALRKY